MTEVATVILKCEEKLGSKLYDANDTDYEARSHVNDIDGFWRQVSVKKSAKE